MEVPTWAAGALTIALIVVLGIFVYPRWLRSSGGRIAVGLCTVTLAALFTLFDSSTVRTPSIAFALAWALAPLAAGLAVWRLQR